MVGTLLFVFHPAFPPNFCDGGSNLMERKVARAELDIFTVLKIAQVEANEALRVSTDESRDVDTAVIGMASVEHEVNERRVSLRIEGFNFADFRFALPPMIVVS